MTLVLALGMVAISGCGGNANIAAPVNTPVLGSGNWLMYVNSANVPLQGNDLYPVNVPLRGSLAISGGTLAATLITNSGVGANCFPSPLAFTGTVSGSAVSLTPAPAEASLAIAATSQPVSIILGTYTCSSKSLGADTGSVFGTYVPSLTGTWTGSLADSNTFKPAPATAVTTSITQAAAASPIGSVRPGSYPLSGTIAMQNSSCIASGSATLNLDATQSYVTGEIVVISAATADNATSLQWAATLDDPTAATSMTRSTNARLSGTCNITFATGAQLKKQ